MVRALYFEAEAGIFSGYAELGIGTNVRTTFGGEILEILTPAKNMSKIFLLLTPRGNTFEIYKLMLGSICYTPLLREHLQDFLRERGLWRTFFRPNAFHHGLLNRLSFTLQIT